MNLKFDKEIPDVFEYVLLGSGRLVLHVANERKSIVLDNVLCDQPQGSSAEEADEPDGSPGHHRPGRARLSRATAPVSAGRGARAVTRRGAIGAAAEASRRSSSRMAPLSASSMSPSRRAT